MHFGTRKTKVTQLYFIIYTWACLGRNWIKCDSCQKLSGNYINKDNTRGRFEQKKRQYAGKTNIQ